MFCLRYPDESADFETIGDTSVKTPTAVATGTPSASAKPSSSSMMLYQVSYVDGKPSYSLVPIKKKPETSPPKECNEYVCDECGLKFTTESRLKWHCATHSPLKNRKQQSKTKPIVRVPPPKNEVVEVMTDSNNRVLAKKICRRNPPKPVAKPARLEKPRKTGQMNDKGLTFICPSCEFSTNDRSIMINHFTSTHCFKTELKAEPKAEERDLSDGEGGVVEVYEDESHHQDIGAVEEVVEMQEMYAEETVIEQLQCAECGFTGYTQDDIDFHTCAPATGEQLFSCPLCTYECLTRMGLQSHITRKHKPKPADGMPRTYDCASCGFKCNNKNTLYSHRRKHRNGGEIVDEKNFFCDVCEFGARTKSALYLHIKRRHKVDDSIEEPSQKPTRPDMYKCDHCDYTNKNRYEMKVHVIRKHTNDYAFECEVCGKKYKIKGDLTNHIRFQHREQPIMCDVCGKTCGNSNSLYVHQKFAHYKAEFECPICHRRMVSQANLDEHVLKQHEQREDAVCEECGKRFTRTSRLKIHMRIHTGLKPHACRICGKAFARKTALRQHLLIHTGQRPYVCDICGKAFTQKPGLISHRKSHPGDHPPLPRVTIDHVLSEFLIEGQEI